MKTKYFFVAAAILTSSMVMANDSPDIFSIEKTEYILVADSDSMKIDVNADVISFDDRLYQLGIQIGTFEKKTSFKKGQLSSIIMIKDMSGKAIAEAIAAGVNASYAITVYGTNEKLSMDLTFDHEAEELAKKLRQMGKL